jgi:hypothetical protein
VLPGAKQRVDEARKQGVSYAVPGYKLNEIAGWAVGFGFIPLLTLDFAGHAIGLSVGLGFVLAFIFGCAGAAIGYRQQERRIAATLAQHAFQRRRHDAMVAPIEAELAELQKLEAEHRAHARRASSPLRDA